MSRRFTKMDGMVERRIGNEHILVPIRGAVAELDSLYNLTEVSTFIFEQAVAGLAEAEIVSRLTAEFDVPAATAAADARRILDELVALSALREIAEGKKT